jgi:hypothetical protein
MNIIGQNLVASGAAIVSLSCLVLPAAQGAPLPSIVMGGLLGIILAVTVVFQVLRWKPVMRLAAKSKKASGASHALAFIQAESLAPNNPVPTDYHGAGWLLVHSDHVTVEFRNSSWITPKSPDTYDVVFADIERVSAREGSSFVFPSLEVVKASGQTLRITLVPADGLWWHGPSDRETSDAASLLRRAL